MSVVPRVLELLRKNEAKDVLVVVGGAIPWDGVCELKALGVGKVFGPGAKTSEITTWLDGRFKP